MICFYCFAMPAWGQKARKVVVIDTVSGEYKSFQAILSSRSGSYPVHDLHIGSDSTDFSFIMYGDSTYSLKLALDNSKTEFRDARSFVEIEGAFSLADDTLHICRFHVYKNCFPDTGSASDYYYKQFKDSKRPLKLLGKKEHIYLHLKDCNDAAPGIIKLIINGMAYCASVDVAQQAYVSIYHPAKRRQQRLKNQGRTYKYHYLNALSRYTVFDARITLR